MKFLSSIKRKIATSRNNRIAIEQLQRMTNRQLADIGINRGDIKRAVKL